MFIYCKFWQAISKLLVKCCLLMVLILGLVFALVLLKKSTLSFNVVDLATSSIPYT